MNGTRLLKEYEILRGQMIRKLRDDYKIADESVLTAMDSVPRDFFVPTALKSQAYRDNALPISANQTISQPYIVALMTQLLRLTRDCEVLEVGTGSGYQTAILARLARRVCTMERLPELLAGAQGVLGRLGIDNVSYELGDGSLGWPMSRVFDRIIVTAAVPDFPPPLVGQLAESGVIVAPLGQEAVQQLVVAEKRLGKLIERDVTNCRFVRLIGEHGFVCRM